MDLSFITGTGPLYYYPKQHKKYYLNKEYGRLMGISIAVAPTTAAMGPKDSRALFLFCGELQIGRFLLCGL